MLVLYDDLAPCTYPPWFTSVFVSDVICILRPSPSKPTLKSGTLRLYSDYCTTMQRRVADSYNRWVVRRRRTNSITVVVSTWRSNNGRRQRWRLTSYVSNNDDVNADCWDKTWRIHSKLMSAAFARCHCQQRAALIVHRYSTRTPSSFTRASHTLIDLPLANSRRCHRDGPTRYPNQSKRWIILRKNKTLHCIAADSDDKRWRDE